MSRLDELTIVPQTTEACLILLAVTVLRYPRPRGREILDRRTAGSMNNRQLLDYRSQREDCLEWLLTLGKRPEQAEGYAFQTVKNRAYRMDMFYRWVWKQEGGYIADVTHSHADKWLRYLACLEKSNAHKNNCRKAVQMLFKWRQYEYGMAEWNPQLSFSSENKSTVPRDYLTQDERSQIREAALEYGSIPKYKNVDPAAGSRWNVYLAQRFEKPKTAITEADWERANG